MQLILYLYWGDSFYYNAQNLYKESKRAYYILREIVNAKDLTLRNSVKYNQLDWFHYNSLGFIILRAPGARVAVNHAYSSSAPPTVSLNKSGCLLLWVMSRLLSSSLFLP